MNIKIESKETTSKKSVVCQLKEMTLEQVETIRDALAVLTEEKAKNAGIEWNNEGTREKLLLSFIGIAEDMRGLSHGAEQIRQ